MVNFSGLKRHWCLLRGGCSVIFSSCFGIVSFASVLFLSADDSAENSPSGEGGAGKAVADQAHWLHPVPASGEPQKQTVQGVLYERYSGGLKATIKEDRSLLTAASNPLSRGVVKGVTVPTEFSEGEGLVRMRAWLVSPKTGSVRLGFASPRKAEIFLSEDQDCFKRRKLAWNVNWPWRGWSPPDPEGQKKKTQWSEDIELIEGQTYYLEYWYQSKEGEDQSPLRWQWLGEESPLAIPSEALRPFIPSPEDSNDNGLPDLWEQQVNLAELPDATSWSDSDGDGVSNLDEFHAGTDPLDSGFTSGVLRWDLWYDVPGVYVRDFTKSAHFTRHPDQSQLLPSTITPMLTAGNVASRLTGYLVPEVSGTYQFALSADDSAEFWLSTDDQSENRRLLAFCDTWKRPKRYRRIDAQMSELIELEAGRSYFLEILHKDHITPGHIELVWRQVDPLEHSQRTSPESEEALNASLRPIPSSILRSPRDTPESRAIGNLKHSWVEQYRGGVTGKDPSGLDQLAPYANPSGDKLPNWMKARDGLNPFTRHETQGGLAREWWFRSRGSSLEIARRRKDLLHEPHMFSITPGAATQRHTTNYYLSRARGSIIAPVDATYRFWISGDDHCELWLSSSDSKFYKSLIAHVGPGPDGDPESGAWTHPLDWDKFASQKSAQINLKEGDKRFVEVLLKHGNGPDHFAVAWQYKRPGDETWSNREVIPSEYLLAFAGDPDDLDDDYLPDSWETKYGLSASGNGRRGPLQGEYGDYDEDGLTNREEFLMGTDPTKADSDGDGVSDTDEIEIYGTNPIVQDASPPVLVSSPSLLNPNSDGPAGFTEDDHLIAIQNYGHYSFTVSIAEPGVYLLELDAGAQVRSFAPPLPIVAYINDREVGRASVNPDGSVHRWLTPWLPAGNHVVTISDRNPRVDAMLLIKGLHLYRHTSANPSENDQLGVPEWLRSILRRENQITTEARSSLISPFSIGGTWRWEGDGMARIDGQEQPLLNALTGTWYFPLELASDGAGTPIEVSLDSGLVTEEISVTWEQTHPFALNGEALHLPVGGALRLARVLVPDGDQSAPQSLSYALDGVSLSFDAESTTPDSWIQSFESPGSFSLTALSDGGPETAELVIHVHAADFGSSYSLEGNTQGQWELLGFSKEVALETDPEIYVATDRSEDFLEGRRLLVTSVQNLGGTHRIVSRLPGSEAIISAGSVEVYSIIPATTTKDSRQLETLADGTRVVEMSFGLQGAIPEDLELWIVLIVPDAVFANGQARIRLTADDFDENGITRIKVYKAPGEGIPYICHNIYTSSPPPPSNEQ